MLRAMIVRTVVLLAILTSGAVAYAADALRIGWLRAPNDITLAKAHGSIEAALKPMGIAVEWIGPFAAAAPAFEALNAGAIDLTAGSSTSAISGLAAQMPFVVFAYQKMSAGAEAILVPKTSTITSIGDLKGKSVAVNRGGTGEYLLVRALETHGIDVASVKRIYLSPADSAAALATGHVDAWATWDPFVTMAKANYDARVLADGAAIGSQNAVVLVASRDLAEKRAAVLKVVFETLEQENGWAVAHPLEAGRIWSEAMSLKPELSADIGANSAVPTRGLTADDVVQMGAIADWSLAQGIVRVRPDVAKGVVEMK
jgi:sulfonate transport system substrate-binding protein